MKVHKSIPQSEQSHFGFQRCQVPRSGAYVASSRCSQYEEQRPGAERINGLDVDEVLRDWRTHQQLESKRPGDGTFVFARVE